MDFEREIEKCRHKIHAMTVAKSTRSLKKRLISESPQCMICGFDFEPVLQIHHVLPISEYGDNDERNVIVVCPTCHKVLHKAYSAIRSNDFNKLKSVIDFVDCYRYENVFKAIVYEYIHSDKETKTKEAIEKVDQLVHGGE